METDTQTTAALTRKIVRDKIAAFNLRERELIKQGQGLYASGGGAGASGRPAVSGDDLRQNERVRAMLNGAGSLLPALAAHNSEQDVETQLKDVRLALEVLNRADLEQAAIEAATWAIANTPAWQARVRKLVLAMAALVEADADCTDFLESAGGDRANALPFTNIYGSYGGVEFRGWMTPKQVFDAAVDEGLVKASELKGARNA